MKQILANRLILRAEHIIFYKVIVSIKYKQDE